MLSSSSFTTFDSTDGIKKTTEKEEKTLEEDDLRNKLNMQIAKREQLIELGLDPPETNKSPEQTQQSEPIASAEPAAPSRQALEEGALGSEVIPQFPDCDEEVSMPECGICGIKFSNKET